MQIHFDEELNLLKQKLLQMADTAQWMIGTSIQALVERRLELTEEVLKTERKVNALENEIEDETLKLMATRQPAAKDLRLLVSILKIISDLERIADQACNISETAQYLLKEPPLKPLIDIPRMATIAQMMVKDAIESFVHHDTDLAQKVCEHDDEVDSINRQLFRELLTYMMENPKSITRAVDLILVSRNIERIADHATNICEDVIFIEKGKNIKHHALDEESTT